MLDWSTNLKTIAFFLTVALAFVTTTPCWSAPEKSRSSHSVTASSLIQQSYRLAKGKADFVSLGNETYIAIGINQGNSLYFIGTGEDKSVQIGVQLDLFD